ncbi:MAG: hypothetical protein AAGM33_02595, partial [Pseudomonadota bacterium]
DDFAGEGCPFTLLFSCRSVSDFLASKKFIQINIPVDRADNQNHRDARVSMIEAATDRIGHVAKLAGRRVIP